MGFIKILIMMTVLTLIFVFVGFAFGEATGLGGTNGAYIALAIAFVMNFISFWFSDKIVLAMYHAEEITGQQNPRLYGIVSRLSKKAGLPMPKVCVIPMEQPNAFATGRSPKKGVVAVTNGIMRILNEKELEGVIAHELSHIKHRDILLGSVVATLVGAITIFVRMGFFGRRGRGNLIFILIGTIVAPFAALLIQMSISRTREFKADRGSAMITGEPQYLASALLKLHSGVSNYKMNTNPASSHLFIVNPLSAGGIASLFSTHPPIEKRIEKLKNIR